MEQSPLPRRIPSLFLLTIAFFLLSCQGMHQSGPGPAGPVTNANFNGVLMWKGNSSENGLYAAEATSQRPM